MLGLLTTGPGFQSFGCSPSGWPTPALPHRLGVLLISMSTSLSCPVRQLGESTGRSPFPEGVRHG